MSYQDSCSWCPYGDLLLYNEQSDSMEIEEEDLLHEVPEYISIRALGQGAFGTVILAKNTEGPSTEVAIKFLARGSQMVTRQVQRELVTQNSLCHPHIVHLQRTFLTGTHLGIVLEYMPGSDLFQYCESRSDISEMRVKNYMQQIFAAIHYMHRKGVVNRDIKLDNLLLDKSRKVVKVADFSFAKGPYDSLPKSNVGTPNYIGQDLSLDKGLSGLEGKQARTNVVYAAPEIVRGGQYDGGLVDIWSCGVCLYVLRYRKYPFTSPNDPAGPEGYRRVTMRTLTGDFTMPDKHDVTDECKDLIRKCLQPNPLHRISIAEILNHQWFPPQYANQVETLTRETLLMRPSPITDEEMQRYAEEARRLPSFDLNRQVDAHLQRALQQERRGGGQILASV